MSIGQVGILIFLRFPEHPRMPGKAEERWRFKLPRKRMKTALVLAADGCAVSGVGQGRQ